MQGQFAKEGSILELSQPMLMAFGKDGPLVGCLRGQRVPRELSTSNKLVNILPGAPRRGDAGHLCLCSTMWSRSKDSTTTGYR